MLTRIATRGFNSTQSRDESNQGVIITKRRDQHGALGELETAMTDNYVYQNQQGITMLRSHDEEMRKTRSFNICSRGFIVVKATVSTGR